MTEYIVYQFNQMDLAAAVRTASTPPGASRFRPTPNADSDSDGYTNLEEWLHCQACAVEGRICTGC